MTSYKIIRFRLNGPNQVIKRGLTLKEAQAHCRNPETSSSTASYGTLQQVGRDPWFDGFDKE